ncbi:class I SAM-dependent methyltransferase [Martelella endophytica]|nr:methyltransferase domain-containing protein [Martelella endophytica]
MTDAHADAMDAMYRYQRHIYDLTRKYYLFGRDGLIAGLDVPPGGSLLEVACGTGRNLKKAEALYPEARLYGFDISEEMLASARGNFRNDAASFIAADACRFKASDFGAEGFDRIMISYALSMIPDWRRAVVAALDALLPEGQLHVVDFGQQEKLPRAFRVVLRAWLARFHVHPRAEMMAVLAEEAGARGMTLAFHSVGGGYAWYAVLRRQ